MLVAVVKEKKVEIPVGFVGFLTTFKLGRQTGGNGEKRERERESAAEKAKFPFVCPVNVQPVCVGRFPNFPKAPPSTYIIRAAHIFSWRNPHLFSPLFAFCIS